MSQWPVWSVMLLLTTVDAVEGEDVRAGCSTAVNDLVYIVDGSWSVGLADFDTAKQWLINISSQFDISPNYTQVAVVQYSDTPRLEIPLGSHLSGAELLQAIRSIDYLGGNTQARGMTGAFSLGSLGKRRNSPWTVQPFQLEQLYKTFFSGHLYYLKF
ncbi:hypothetical protein XENOCAPTIV_015884 [Xenoophorus captivus]|uniref:VWFA domain-containing protein n=1 Tax=Xenoophorus captivus TaxID=1517983 RepID=A0ABV0S0V2_9TELE